MWVAMISYFFAPLFTILIKIDIQPRGMFKLSLFFHFSYLFNFFFTILPLHGKKISIFICDYFDYRKSKIIFSQCRSREFSWKWVRMKKNQRKMKNKQNNNKIKQKQTYKKMLFRSLLYNFSSICCFGRQRKSIKNIVMQKNGVYRLFL